jgi:glycosyltransferase involved in cell wall biosynthesis
VKRLLVIYQHFGPYHAARWCALRPAAASAGLEAVGLQLFARAGEHDWEPPGALEGVTDLALSPVPYEGLRWADAPRLWRSLDAHAPDVVAINGWRTRESLVAHAWCRRRRVPRLVVSDSLPAVAGAAWFRDFGKRAIIRGVGSAFVAGTPQRRYLQSLGVFPAAIWQGCDAVDNAHFAVARGTRGPGGHRLLTVARFSPEKNLRAAAQAFMRFVAARPAHEPWRWRLAGDGPQRDALRQVADGSGGRIELLGWRSYRQLPDAYADADLYWQPSLRDTWALPVNEAMASGLPVLVSARCGCSEDLVTANTGWVCDAASDEALYVGLQRAAAARDAWPAMGEAAARHVAGWGLDAFTAGLLGSARCALAGAAG